LLSDRFEYAGQLIDPSRWNGFSGPSPRGSLIQSLDMTLAPMLPRSRPRWRDSSRGLFCRGQVRGDRL